MSRTFAATTPLDGLGEQLLQLDGVFHVLVVNDHGDVVLSRAKDRDVSDAFFKSVPNIAMRLSIIRTAANVHRDPAGTFRSAQLEYDRVALVLFPVEDGTVGIALLKEHATNEVVERARTVIATPSR